MVKEFFHLIACVFSREKRRQMKRLPPNGRLILMIIVATLPLFVILPIKDKVEGLYGNTIFVGCALAVTGCILFFSDRMARGKKGPKSATMLDALLVGVGQAVAVVPGLSRSGTTISAGMMRGFHRRFAVRFSFLLSIPAVLGANILSIGEAVREGIDVSLLPAYIVGTLVAAVSGYFAIRLVNLLADKGKFGNFAVMPSAASSRLRYWALVLRMLPSSSSVPTLMISAVMDKSTLEFYLIGDADADALGVLGGLGFQCGKARHGGFGFQDLFQLRADLRVRGREDGAAVLIGQDAGFKGIDVPGRLHDLGLVHADERAQDGHKRAAVPRSGCR